MKIQTLLTTICAVAVGTFLAASSASAQLVTFINDNFSANQVGATTTNGTITPLYSKDGTVWTVNSGTFATNGDQVGGNYLPVAGKLNFGAVDGTAITLPFGNVQAGNATISFDLSQSNGGFAYERMQLFVTDNADHVYAIYLTGQPAYFGGGATATGIALLAPNVVLGTPAAVLSSNQTISLAFDPATGFSMSSSTYGSPILTFTNQWGSSSLKSMQFVTSGAASWFVDNVNVQAVPEPSTFAMLGLSLAGLAFIRRRRA